MTITPEQLAKGASEHAEQCALFCWAALAETQQRFPSLKLMFAIPNGGERNIKVAGQMKAEGVKAGVLDIFLPVPKMVLGVCMSHGLWIEMKYGKNKPSSQQTEFATAMREQGYEVALCYSWQAARDILIAYLS